MGLSPGHLTILSVLAIGTSWILGALMGRIVPELLNLGQRLRDYFRKQPRHVDEPDEQDVALVERIFRKDHTTLGKNLEYRYEAKSLFRSMMFALLLLYLSVPPWSTPDRVCLMVNVLFWVLEPLFVWAFFIQRKSHHSLFDAMENATFNVKPRGETDRGG
jgi:hypothetical protein